MLPALAAATPWSEEEMLRGEKEALGLYLSGHPLERHAEGLKAAGALTSAHAGDRPERRRRHHGRHRLGLPDVKTRKGDRMAVFMLEDQTGSVEVVVYPEPYQQFASFIENDRMVVVTGRVEVDEERAKMRATEVKDLKAVTERFVKEVCVSMQAPPHGHETFRALADVFLRHRGDKRVQFELRVRRDAAGPLLVKAEVPQLRVRPSGRLVLEVERICGKGRWCCANARCNLDETMPETLEFEEPIAILLKEIEALGMLPQTDVRDGEIEGLRRRIDQIRGEIYKRLTPWQRVLVARHPERPYLLDYVERLFTDFVELHGDRRFGDDGAIVCGFARYHGAAGAWSVGHQKGRDTKQKVQRNFGYARPEGYRKALRAMQMAEKFGRPIIVFVDTPAAYPGIESEERGIAEAIALNLREMAILERADHRRRHRRGRQRRRARPGHRRPRADAGVRRLQRHSARGLRRDPVARRRPARSRRPRR